MLNRTCGSRDDQQPCVDRIPVHPRAPTPVECSRPPRDLSVLRSASLVTHADDMVFAPTATIASADGELLYELAHGPSGVHVTRSHRPVRPRDCSAPHCSKTKPTFSQMARRRRFALHTSARVSSRSGAGSRN